MTDRRGDEMSAVRRNQRLQRRSALAGGAAALLFGAGLSGNPSTAAASEKRHSPEPARRMLKALAPLHERKQPSRPGDWLAEHAEAGQSFEQYVRSGEAPVAEKYGKLYVQPLGAFSKAQEAVVQQTGEMMAAFFGMPVVTAPTIALKELPKSAQRINAHTKAPQWLTTYLMQSVLKPRVKKDAAALLGLTAVDLWPGMGWNFVFGQASLRERIGVWSLARNGNAEGEAAERTLFLRRTLKTAMHETGHMLGILHCIAYECGMNGSNHREESDRQPLEFCPECQAKIYWTCKAEPVKRLTALAKLSKEWGLVKESEFFEKEREAAKGS